MYESFYSMLISLFGNFGKSQHSFHSLLAELLNVRNNCIFESLEERMANINHICTFVANHNLSLTTVRLEGLRVDL